MRFIHLSQNILEGLKTFSRVTQRSCVHLFMVSCVSAMIGCVSGCTQKEPSPEVHSSELNSSSEVVIAPDDKTSVDNEYRTIEWTDLIPKDDLDALLSPPEYLNEIEDGSEGDQINSKTQNALSTTDDDASMRYQQALVSKRIIPEFNQQKVRIPGFIVPLEFTEQLNVKEFFIVPYFGACIHLPAPPPNQVIYVTLAKSVRLESLNDPFWITGTLATSIIENDVATAAYTLSATSVMPYEEPLPNE
jgi:uncharacterized protein